MQTLSNRMTERWIGPLFEKLRGRLIDRVCDELQRNYQAIEDLAFFLLIGMITLACQDGAYVRMVDGRLIPLSGYFVTSAPSGSGKSTLLARLLRPFREAETQAVRESAHHHLRYQADFLVWKGRIRHVTREINEAIAGGEDASDVSDRLSVLLADEPLPPRTASWLTEDATIQALRRRLHKGWPSAGIVLDEGIRFLKSGLSRAFADFCTLHDARLARNDRVSTGEESVESAFLSMVIATQPGPLFAYLDKHGQKAFETGFLARLQLLDVQSPITPRVPNGDTMRQPALSEYDERVVALKRDACKRMRKNGAFEPLVIDISASAVELLATVPQRIQARAASEGYSSDMGPYLLRVPDLVARVAGVLHRFEGCEGPIAEDTMSVAIEIAFWLAQETNKVLTRLLEPSASEKADIDTVGQMLNAHLAHRRRLFLSKSELWAMAPSFGMDEARCKRALHHLCKAKWVWLESRGNATIIRLSPHFFRLS
ncbi:DUF3987 domain-containing protein [Trinickia sp. NRRL B-1857]|uniref:DUF3987 domain-containing protein n=1 Tax=Trinickia sp. NRRL B-1857 TaxID=3162879 RepID=UPI003D2DD121